MANQVKFELYLDVNDEYRWRLIAGNGEIVAASQAYTQLASAKRSAENVIAISSVAIITYHENLG